MTIVETTNSSEDTRTIAAQVAATFLAGNRLASTEHLLNCATQIDEFICNGQWSDRT